ncbi:MAG TPA: hypothetical protein VES95_07510, partial [Dermatophilaceae bacterium]|nr:hypothetical protein [Dermatophilaceae bacterium]
MTVEPDGASDGDRGLWRSRILLALADATDDHLSELWLLQEVAARTAHRFTAYDRTYVQGVPRWHGAARAALATLSGDGLVMVDEGVVLTDAGREAAGHLTPEPLTGGEAGADEASEEPGSPAGGRERGPLVTPGVIATPLRDPRARAEMRFPGGEDVQLPVMVELNLRYAGGPRAAFAALASLWQRCTGERSEPLPLAEDYATGTLSMSEMKRLVTADAAAGD